MKKILMLNYELTPVGGGAGVCTYNIAKEMVKKGYQVTIVTSRYKDQKKEEFKEGIKIYRVYSKRIGVHDCGLMGAFTYVLSASIKMLQLNLREHFDIVHYFFTLPTGILSLLPWAFRKQPYVVSLRGSDVPFYDVYNKKIHKMNLMLRPLIRYIWKKAGALTAVSESLKQTALVTAPGQKITAIPNAVEAEFFLKKERTSDNKLKLITVSRLIKRKGIDHIIRALTLIKDKDISLLIVGEGPCEKELKELIANLGLQKKVRFFGFCTRTELPNLYKEADVFILPSLAEAFGIVFVEAMASSLPIISVKAGGIQEFVTQENGILVEPGNVEQIKEAILTMFNSKEELSLIGERNRKKVLEEYRWDQITEKYLKEYRKTFNKKEGGINEQE